MFQLNPALPKAFLIFYLIITASYTNELVSKQMKTFLDENRLAKHLLGLITMFVLINTVAGLNDQKMAALYAVILYTWFVFSTKLDIHWNMIIIALLFVGYLHDNYVEEKQNTIITDFVLSSDDKKKLLDECKEQKDKNMYVLAAVLAVTLAGTLFYTNKKEIQYGGGFDVMKYLLY